MSVITFSFYKKRFKTMIYTVKPLLEFSYQTNLKKLMKDVGFKSVKALAVQTEIGVTTLHNFSIGKANLPIEKLCKLLFALDCTFDELVEYTIIDNSDDSDLYEASFDEESQAIVINDAETKQAFQDFLKQRRQQKAS